MAEQSVQNGIEVIREGIKLPYLRYLSDSGPGFIALLSIIAAYYFYIDQSTLADVQKKVLAIPKEIWLFIGLLSFFIATPLGLVLDAIGWIFLGLIESSMIRLWFAFLSGDAWYQRVGSWWRNLSRRTWYKWVILIFVLLLSPLLVLLYIIGKLLYLLFIKATNIEWDYSTLRDILQRADSSDLCRKAQLYETILYTYYPASALICLRLSRE